MMRTLFQRLNSVRHVGRHPENPSQQSESELRLRVVLGAGGIYQEGWIATDIDRLNIVQEQDWHALFVPNSIDVLLAEHVWEHLTLEEGVIGLKHCFQFLKPGGYFRIAVPDGNHPDPEYIEYV